MDEDQSYGKAVIPILRKYISQFVHIFAENIESMPSNKNAVIRYKYLDEMLSDTTRSYTCSELWQKCNKRLTSIGLPEVTKRTVENDLNDLECAPFCKEIDRSERKGGKTVLRYRDVTRPLFGKELSTDERLMLSEIFDALGHFSGLENFHWFDSIQSKLKSGVSRSRLFDEPCCRDVPVIEFSMNRYLKNSNLIGDLFSAILHRDVLAVTYRKFGDSVSQTLRVYPYMLKQYSDRWYLICTPAGDSDNPYDSACVMNLPLDRIESFERCPGVPYRGCGVDLEEYFDDIVGVTYRKDTPIERILFAISDESADYIRTKPLHSSQTELTEETQQTLHRKHPEADGFTFFTIECIPNYELKSQMRGYGHLLMVISPESFRDDFIHDIEAQMKNYQI